MQAQRDPPPGAEANYSGRRLSLAPAVFFVPAGDTLCRNSDQRAKRR